MTRIVLVHGINNQGKSEDHLIGEWFGALETVLSAQQMSELSDRDIRAPYYGDILKEITDDLPTLPKPTAQSFQTLDDDATAFLAQSVTEMALAQGLDPSFLEAETTGEAVEQSLFHNRYVNAALRYLERASPWKLRYGMLLLRQAYVYLNLAHATQVVDEIVAPVIQEDVPTLVVAHSLGTIVAYKALRGANVSSKVKFITLGSPLGMKSVKRAVKPPYKTPDHVTNWINALDIDDIVTLGRTLGDAGYGDERLEESNRVENGRKDPHSIACYLTEPWVKSHIIASLGL